MLENRYSNFDIIKETKEEYESIEIINPFQDENISVDFINSNDYKELTFYFSYQHAHFGEDIDGLIDYIDLFLADDLAAIEFFDGERNCFGGAILLNQVNPLSASNLASQFGQSINYLLGLNYKIRTWSGKKDFDAIIEKENDEIISRVI